MFNLWRRTSASPVTAPDISASSGTHDEHDAQIPLSNVAINDPFGIVTSQQDGSIQLFTSASSNYSSTSHSDSPLTNSRQKQFTTAVDTLFRTSFDQSKPSNQQPETSGLYQFLDERLQSPSHTISRVTANPSPPLEHSISSLSHSAQEGEDDRIKMKSVSDEELKLLRTSESRLVPETTISEQGTTEPRQANHTGEYGQADSGGSGALDASTETSTPAQPDRNDQAPLISMNPKKYIPSGIADTTKLASRRRRASAPPTYPVGLHVPSCDGYELTKLNFATVIPQSAPAYAQQIAHLQSWCALLPRLTDDIFRTQLATIVGNKMEKIWLEAMRTGIIPIDWQDDIRSQEQAGRTDVNFGDVEIMRQEITEAEVFSQGGRYLATKDKPKKKRPPYPSQEIVIDTRAHGRSKNYAITAGELQEAGVIFTNIQRRVASRKLNDYDELVADILEDIDQESISEVAWRAVTVRTAHNPLGRDLKLYCLWEVEKALSQIQFLENLKPNFKSANQVKNTEKRIVAEQELHDQLLAVASELHAMEQSRCERRRSHDADVMEITEPDSITPGIEIEGSYTANHSQQIIGIDSESETSNSDVVETENARNIHDGQGQGQIPAQNGMLQPIVIVKTNPGIEREANEVESSVSDSEPPSKRPRTLDGASISAPEEIPCTNIDFQLSRGEGDAFTSFSSAFASLPPESAAKQRAYTQYILEPQVNSLLLTRHRPSVPIGTTWSDMCTALRAAGVPASLYEDLIRDLRAKIDAWDVPVDADVGDIEDVPGYPTRKEIWNVFPKEGLTGKELQMMFLDRVSSSDEKWRSLVRSVAHYDPANRRFYSREELQGQLRNRKIVRIRTRLGFNPEEWSCHVLNNYQEFRYRYVPSSTLTQRESMDQAIADHVRHTKLIVKQPVDQQLGMPKKVDYHGRYDVLIHPQDLQDWRNGSGGEPAPIVHGVWDLRGLKKADNRVPGMQWFYEGHDGEVMGKWIVRYETDATGNVNTIWEREREGMDAEDQIAGKHLMKVKTKKAKVRGPGGKGMKHRIDTLLVGSGRGVSAKGNGKGMAVTKGKKRKAPFPEHGPIATSRSKRARKVGVSYAENAADDSDGEYMP